jgi:ATP-dependent Clp protease ATP-binding subunit ClpB
MTSNIGSHLIQEYLGAQNGGEDDAKFEKARLAVFDVLKKTIRPEFLNRVDEIIMFRPLSEKQINEIAKLQIQMLGRKLASNGIKLEIDDKAIDWIAKAGFDPQYGARPVKRVIQRQVMNELSKLILAGRIDKNHRIVISSNGESLEFISKPNGVASTLLSY